MSWDPDAPFGSTDKCEHACTIVVLVVKWNFDTDHDDANLEFDKADGFKLVSV